MRPCSPTTVNHAVLVLSAAASAAPPCLSDVMGSGRYNRVRLSATVTSQIMHQPLCHGINVNPSGSFPSDLSKVEYADGSLIVAVSSSFDGARQIKSPKPRAVHRPIPPFMTARGFFCIAVDHRGTRTFTWFTEAGSTVDDLRRRALHCRLRIQVNRPPPPVKRSFL